MNTKAHFTRVCVTKKNRCVYLTSGVNVIKLLFSLLTVGSITSQLYSNPYTGPQALASLIFASKVWVYPNGIPTIYHLEWPRVLTFKYLIGLKYLRWLNASLCHQFVSDEGKI